MAAMALTIYSRPGCHLCEEMRAVVSPIAAELGAQLAEVDISDNADLEQRFGLEIPVLFVDGRKAFKYRVAPRELRRYLQRHG